MATSLIARLRESQSKPTAQPAQKQMQQPTGQQPPRSLVELMQRQQEPQKPTAQDAEQARSLIGFLRQQQAQVQAQQKTPAPQAAARPRSLIELAQQQAQALNQQPDSIPAMMKPGEYVLPPDTVQALGGPQVLDATVAQTHTPANAGAIVPQGFEPRQFFSNGGLADDERTAQVQGAPGVYKHGSGQYSDNPKGMSIPQGFSTSNAAQQPAPTPKPPTAPAAPATGLPSPAPSSQVNAAAPKPQSVPSMATSAVDLIPRDSGSRYQQSNTPAQPNPATSGIHSTELGRNVYNAAMALPGIGGVAKLASTGGMISRALNFAAGAANTASRGAAALATVPSASPENASAGVTATPPEQLAKQLGGLDRHHAQNVQLQAAARTPEQARAEAAQQSSGQQMQDLPGVYKHGKGQYSDNPSGMGLPQNLGQPSAQNMQAANNLAGQEQKRSLIDAMYAQQEQQQQAAAQPSFQMPRQESAYEREARMRERNSIMSRLQQPMTGDPRRDLTASQRQQMVAQLGQESQERQASARNLLDFARQQMSDQTQRYTADTHAGVGQQRNLIDAARLGMDQQTQGFANRAAQRRESILQRYDNAKTDQERAQLQQQNPEVFGRSSENLSNNFMRRKVPVPDGKGLPTGEQREDIVDLRTGRVLEAPAVPPGAIAELRRNPHLAAQFDAAFGQGAARAYLGGG